MLHTNQKRHGAPIITQTAIDLNADLGEREDLLDEDAVILGAVTSANVACGFHAGSGETMRFVCARAAETGVVIGAHIGYRDREGFGRRDVEIEPDRLIAETIEQLASLDHLAREAGTEIRYVKPHGALYNRCFTDRIYSEAVVEGVRRFSASLSVLGAPGSALTQAALDFGLAAFEEGFIDRGYLPDGGLVQRDQPGALLARSEAVEQARSLATAGSVRVSGGSAIELRVRSLCLHSDSPGAVELADEVRRALREVGVEVRAFA